MALRQVHNSIVDWRDHSFPSVDGVTVESVKSQGWNALRGDFSFPLLVASRSAIEYNLARMARYCRDAGVALAPHGKTHMSPQLWERQRAAGAWAVTVANVSQARVFARTGTTRILIANEVVDAHDLAWIQRERQRGVEFIILVDSLRSVELANDGLSQSPSSAPLDVLVELGITGGRAGTRDREEALGVARAVHSSPALRLRGVEGFEGVFPATDQKAGRAGVRGYLSEAASTLRAMIDEGLVNQPIATFGGSSFFDLVVETFADWPGAEKPFVILRSGCYLTHDHGLYAQSSPLGGNEAFLPALEVWSRVLSTPEPGLAIAGFGKRDAPQDAGMPVPLKRLVGGRLSDLTGTRVISMNDQHAYLRVPPEVTLDAGDLMSAGISHPCTAFDRWRLIPEVDDDYGVVDALRTYF